MSTMLIGSLLFGVLSDRARDLAVCKIPAAMLDRRFVLLSFGRTALRLPSTTSGTLASIIPPSHSLIVVCATAAAAERHHRHDATGAAAIKQCRCRVQGYNCVQCPATGENVSPKFEITDIYAHCPHICHFACPELYFLVTRFPPKWGIFSNVLVILSCYMSP